MVSLMNAPPMIVHLTMAPLMMGPSKTALPSMVPPMRAPPMICPMKTELSLKVSKMTLPPAAVPLMIDSPVMAPTMMVFHQFLFQTQNCLQWHLQQLHLPGGTSGDSTAFNPNDTARDGTAKNISMMKVCMQAVVSGGFQV